MAVASGLVFAACLTESLMKRLFSSQRCVIVVTQPEPVAVEAEQGRCSSDWDFNALTGMGVFFVNSYCESELWSSSL